MLRQDRDATVYAARSGWRSNQCSTTCRILGSTIVVKGSEQQDHFVLWNLRGNYRVCRFANLFIKGENLLAQRYEINAGYPMPKATFMGGINLNF